MIRSMNSSRNAKVPCLFTNSTPERLFHFNSNPLDDFCGSHSYRRPTAYHGHTSDIPEDINPRENSISILNSSAGDGIELQTESTLTADDRAVIHINLKYELITNMPH